MDENYSFSQYSCVCYRRHNKEIATAVLTFQYSILKTRVKKAIEIASKELGKALDKAKKEHIM